MFRGKSFDDLTILVRDFFYKNNYKILVALTLALPLYWIILKMLTSFHKGGDPAYGLGIILLSFFLIFAGVITFFITILPVKFYEKFMAVFSSLILGSWAFFCFEGYCYEANFVFNFFDLLLWGNLWVIYLISLITAYILYYILVKFKKRFDLRRDLHS